jgi:peptidyl-dipeptidase Dcp
MYRLELYALAADVPKQDADAFKTKALAATGLDTNDVPTRYRSTHFLHIWSNGYSAGIMPTTGRKC